MLRSLLQQITPSQVRKISNRRAEALIEQKVILFMDNPIWTVLVHKLLEIVPKIIQNQLILTKIMLNILEQSEEVVHHKVKMDPLK